MKQEIMREIIPLTQSDCFTLFSRVKEKLDFPLHYHEEYELNLILHAGGTKRIVGDHVEEIGAAELVLVGPNLYHTWFTHKCQGQKIRELTIQFHCDLFEDRLLLRNQLSFIKDIFDMARHLVCSHYHRAPTAAPAGLEHSTASTRYGSCFPFCATSRNMRMLSTSAPDNELPNHHSRRLENVFAYLNAHYRRPVTLAEVAKVANMPETSFSRFIKKRLGNTFTDSLNEIRLGHATRLLIDTTHNVTEVAYKCGFNNISNFNRTFKKRKGCTPKEFCSNYSGSRIFI